MTNCVDCAADVSELLAMLDEDPPLDVLLDFIANRLEGSIEIRGGECWKMTLRICWEFREHGCFVGGDALPFVAIAGFRLGDEGSIGRRRYLVEAEGLDLVPVSLRLIADRRNLGNQGATTVNAARVVAFPQLTAHASTHLATEEDHPQWSTVFPSSGNISGASWDR